MSQNLTTPVARLVNGSVSTLQAQTDEKGQPKLGKDGQPAKSCWFHIAIPKGTERHWAETQWGATIWAEGHRAHPTFAPHPTFAWKIEDGDSRVPNKRGKVNADREGHAGHWILKFYSGFVPKTYNRDGTAEIPADQIKLGYYVQVNLNVAGNTGPSPGVYLNPSMVALAGYGEEIAFGPDVSEAGFGAAPLPAGASATPVGGFAPPPQAAPAPAAYAPPPQAAPAPAAYAPPPQAAPAPAAYAPPPQAAPAPAAYAPPPQAAPAPAAYAPPPQAAPAPAAYAPPPQAAPAPVVPNTAFLAAPSAPAAPAVPRQMRGPDGAVYGYDALIAQGWNDALLAANGYTAA